MNAAHHHTEWLGLIDQSGPFLSLPVLLRVFPQGLDTVAAGIRYRVAAAYAQWHDSQAGARPDPVLHREWIGFVLGEVLGLPAACLLQDQALPPHLTLTKTEEGETLRPDLALVRPDVPGDGQESAVDTKAARVHLLVSIHAAGQNLDRAIPGRRWKASPAARMAELLRALDVPLGLVTNGEDWLLVHAPRELAASQAAWQAGLWIEEPLTLRALTSLLGLRRFFGVASADTLPALFAESFENQQDVTEALGLQVRHAVEILIQSLDRLDKERGRDLLKGQGTERLYEAGLTVMMRLVFLLFAEERSLLPSGNPLYDQHYAVSTLGAQLREVADRQGEEVLERRFDAWNRLLALFRLIYAGSEYQDLRLPAYGGELFDPGRFPFLEGHQPDGNWRRTPADPLPINNRTVLHLLDALQPPSWTMPSGPGTRCSALAASRSWMPSISTAAGNSGSACTRRSSRMLPGCALNWRAYRTTVWARSRARRSCSMRPRSQSVRPACSPTW